MTRKYTLSNQTSIFGLCFMSICLLKSNCYSLIYSSLDLWCYCSINWNNCLVVLNSSFCSDPKFNLFHKFYIFIKIILLIIIKELPFGGVGYSGMGSYHGKHGFDTFTHYKVQYFFQNFHRVKSSLLSLELSFRSLLQGRQTSK